MVGYRIRQLPREFQFDSGVGASDNNPPQPKLVLLSRLHLDSGPYTLVLTAYDDGEPTSLTGSTTILVSVEDSNDHEPTFEKQLVIERVCSVAIIHTPLPIEIYFNYILLDMLPPITLAASSEKRK